jgi:hypothetical protein
MNTDTHPPNRSECEICNQLKDLETSFAKWGWEEMDRPLPQAAARLTPGESLDGYDRERRHLRRCPICGTAYLFEWSYEYLVNGSEDEEVLTRLTQAQAEAYLSSHLRAANSHS